MRRRKRKRTENEERMKEERRRSGASMKKDVSGVRKGSPVGYARWGFPKRVRGNPLLHRRAG